MTRLTFGTLGVIVGVCLATPAAAQTEPEIRADVLRQERQEKEAELWPEQQSPFVNRVNALVERGLRDGQERAPTAHNSCWAACDPGRDSAPVSVTGGEIFGEIA
jgi:hypothetical protein